VVAEVAVTAVDLVVAAAVAEVEAAAEAVVVAADLNAKNCTPN
jgi:hypothetical protein